MSMRFARLALLVLMLGATTAAAADGRVVVLLGETDGYMAAAARYWSGRWSARHVVHGVGSLAELREVLTTHSLRGDASWREIVLVSHASEWSGLQVPLYPGGDNATPGELVAAHKSGEFPGLRSSILDVGTIVHLEGCGVGRRPDLLDALVRLLSADGQIRLSASPNLVSYLDDGSGMVRRTELPYASRIINDLSRSEATLAGLAAEVRVAQGPDAQGRLASERRPVGVRLPLPEDISSSRLRPERLAARYEPLRNRLTELGFTPAQLRWRIERGTGGGLDLVGEAFVLVVRPDIGIAIGTPDGAAP